ncbi:MAG TPA: glycosyltransferase [Candidatus Limnocylindrales bacterium]
MNVVLYVMNDLRHDSRVIREARALAAAGHRVTVMTTTPASPLPEGQLASAEPFDTIAVAIPRRWPLWYVWLKHPWRVAGRAWAEARSVRRQPDRAGHAVAYTALSIASIPWMLTRAAWDVVTRVLLRRPARPGVLDYLLRWRVFTLGWTRLAAARAPRADVHHANDMDTLPAALAAAERDGAAVVYDSHEIFLESGAHGRQPRWIRWLMRRWERRMAGRTAALITINDVCAAELGRRLRPRRVVVVHSCSPRWDPPSFAEDRIRRATGIAADAPVVLCHGGFGAGRGIEETAAAMRSPSLAGAHLVLLGRPTPAVDAVLRTFPDRDRVHVLPPVPPDDVVAWVAGADVDVMTLLPVGLNHVVSTPNKLFESIAAGVPVVSSDFPARRAIVLGDPAGPLGELCDPTDPSAIAAAIARLLALDPEARADLRRRILAAAHERWNWETESAKLVDLYTSLEGDRPAAFAAP